MAGTEDKVTGKTKEALGKVTGDPDLEAEGKTQSVKGKVVDAIDSVKDKIKHMKDGKTDHK